MKGRRARSPQTFSVLGVPWPILIAEFAGTALLLAIGLSFVIVDFGTGAPLVGLITSSAARRALTGFLFGSTGALIALSPVGKLSGAHINPMVSLAFWQKGVMTAEQALGYIVAQLGGAVVGTVPLLLWHGVGRSIMFGATSPGPTYGVLGALGGEIVTTAALVIGIFLFVGHRPARKFTPLLFPFLYALMVYLEAPLSGTSTNTARSLGPAVVSHYWHGFWVYVVGPAVGAALATRLHATSWLRHFRVDVAKVYHFEHDAYGMFRQAGGLRKERARHRG